MHIDQFQYFIIYSYLAPTLGWIKWKKIIFLFLNLTAFFKKIFAKKPHSKVWVWTQWNWSIFSKKSENFIDSRHIFRTAAGKSFPQKNSSIITGIIWYTNMAALLLFWHKKYSLCDYMWKTSYDIKQHFRIQIVLTRQLV